MGAYASSAAGLGAIVRRRRALPDRLPAADLALLCIATHKLSRLITRDKAPTTVT